MTFLFINYTLSTHTTQIYVWFCFKTRDFTLKLHKRKSKLISARDVRGKKRTKQQRKKHVFKNRSCWKPGETVQHGKCEPRGWRKDEKCVFCRPKQRGTTKQKAAMKELSVGFPSQWQCHVTDKWRVGNNKTDWKRLLTRVTSFLDKN